MDESSGLNPFIVVDNIDALDRRYSGHANQELGHFATMSVPTYYEELTTKERAIIKLHEKTEVYRYRWTARSGYRRVKTESNTYWQKEKVAEALGISVEEVEKTLKKFGTAAWTQDKVLKYMKRFVWKHKRWPTSAEFNSPVKHGIMKDTSMWRVESPNGFARGYPAVQDILSREKGFPVEALLTIPNLTVRRDAINRYGFDKLVTQGLAQKVEEDEFGILWHIPMTGDEDLFFVEVINSTPEPDGTYAHYHLRVPPEMTTPQQAVAWSFGVPTDAEWQDFKIKVAT